MISQLDQGYPQTDYSHIEDYTVRKPKNVKDVSKHLRGPSG